ncbi:MAG: hypothetical protein KGM17_14990 [Sphingomonadales bacterium]|nr:hypothetical protein [Sphingomonadales bacterium]
MKPIPLLAAIAVLALSGCHRDGKGGDQRTASGQVLQGSISDAMIPYEALTSKPPLAPRVAAKPARGAAADATGDAAAADGAPADAAPAPPSAAAPAATPSSAIHY